MAVATAEGPTTKWQAPDAPGARVTPHAALFRRFKLDCGLAGAELRGGVDLDTLRVIAALAFDAIDENAELLEGRQDSLLESAIRNAVRSVHLDAAVRGRLAAALSQRRRLQEYRRWGPVPLRQIVDLGVCAQIVAQSCDLDSAHVGDCQESTGTFPVLFVDQPTTVALAEAFDLLGRAAADFEFVPGHDVGYIVGRCPLVTFRSMVCRAGFGDMTAADHIATALGEPAAPKLDAYAALFANLRAGTRGWRDLGCDVVSIQFQAMEKPS